MTGESGRNLSDDAKADIFKRSGGDAWVQLVEFNHPNFSQPVRICDSNKDLLPNAGVRGLISNGEEYIFLPFEIERPVDDDTGTSTAKITIDNIDRSIIQNLREADSNLSIDITVVRDTAPDSIEIQITDMKIKGAYYDALTVVIEFSTEFFDLEPFPEGRFNPSDWPAIF